MTIHIEGVECHIADRRAALTDDEFWEDVAGQPYVEPDFDLATNQSEPCPECGEHGGCAIDAEGRVLIHITTNGDDE